MIFASNGILITIRPPRLPAHHEGKVELIYSPLMCHFIKNRTVWCLKYLQLPLQVDLAVWIH